MTLHVAEGIRSGVVAFVDDLGIWLLRPNGRRTLLVARGDAFSWSPDGALAYLVYNPSNDDEDLYVRRGNEPPFPISEHVDFAPSWSPDATQLAFTYTLDGSAPISTIVVSDLAGHTRELASDSSQPDWRP